MIVDSSALMAVIRSEPEAPALLGALRDARARTSAATLLETAIVLGPEMAGRLDSLVETLGLELVAFDAAQLAAARAAMSTFGKGRRNQAQLNIGDCMSYALAKVTGEPLLFNGDHFTHTDIPSAL